MSTTYPKITIKNSLKKGIVIYDAFQNDVQDKSVANYFGTLTAITTVAAGEEHTFTPIHGPISTYIIFDTENKPITREFSIGMNPATFTITQAAVDVMDCTEAFLKLIQDSPTNATVVQFQHLIQHGKASAQEVNQFFQKTEDYNTVTFISYMLAVVALARTPKTIDKPPQEQEYSLSTLATYMGFDWPSSIPDVTLSHVHCSETSEAVKVGGELNINNVTFADGVLAHILSFLPEPTINFAIEFIYNDGLSTGVTCLTFGLDEIEIPITKNKAFTIEKPTMLLTLNPLFKFVVFEIKATIPFNIFNSPTIDANIAMTIDNVEAEIGVELTGNSSTLLTPPGIKGLHFDSFGIGMGLIFEPAGFAIGLEGTFHIGNQGQVALTDDKFAIICEMEDEVPNPLYLAFYVPKLDLSEVITLFTNTTVDIDIPVTFEQLSFRWAENPMEPVILPDGSLAPMGYGFSGYMDVFGLKFYGYLEIDMNTGVHGTITMNKLAFGELLTISGDGKGVTIKEIKGNAVPNNTIPKTAADQKAIKEATTKQLITAGGPEMTISTSSSPYFTMDAKISLFDLINEKIDASINNSGIAFELDYGAVLQTKMSCVLKDYHNFSGNFSYGIDINVPLPTIAGFSLGSIHLDTACAVKFAISTSTAAIKFAIQGAFKFEGVHLHFGPFEAAIDISKITEVISAIGAYIVAHAKDIFADFIQEAQKWVGYVKDAVIHGVTDVAKGLKEAYNKTATETASIMNSVGYKATDIASGIGSAYNYSATQIAKAMEAGFGATDQVVADAFKGIGIGAKATAEALHDVFELDPKDVKNVMIAAQYSEDAVKDAFESIGGAFKDAADKIWGAVSHWDHW